MISKSGYCQKFVEPNTGSGGGVLSGVRVIVTAAPSPTAVAEIEILPEYVLAVLLVIDPFVFDNTYVYESRFSIQTSTPSA